MRRAEDARLIPVLDLPGQPALDKRGLIGTCALLPLRVDATRFAEEIEALGAAVWGSTGGRIGVHSAAEALFLRGHAPAEGALPIEDRPVLDRLPYAREVIAMLAAPPLRCLLARLPAGCSIALHRDQAPYFDKSIRIHVPVTTHPRAYMLCDDECFVMQAGEVWALNNSTFHGVWNADPHLARTHMICDYTLTPALEELLHGADRGRGRPAADVHSQLARRPG